MEEAAALALASLPGRNGVQATSQEGATLACDPFQLDGEVLRAYVPRLKLGGVQRLTLRFAVSGNPWRAEFELEQAEYHSFEQAIAKLRLLAIQRDGAGRQMAPVRGQTPTRVANQVTPLPYGSCGPSPRRGWWRRSPPST